MSHAEFNDDLKIPDARTNLDPWVKQGISEAEYNERLDNRRLAKFEAVKAELKEITPKLIAKHQDYLVRSLVVQFQLDWNSYDLKNAMYAAQLYLHGQRRKAKQILDGIIGINWDAPSSASRSVHPTPYAPEGNIKYTGDMTLEISGKFDKELLRDIGSGRK